MDKKENTRTNPNKQKTNTKRANQHIQQENRRFPLL